MKVNNSNKKFSLLKKCYKIKVTRLSVFKEIVNTVQIVRSIQYKILSRKLVSFVECSDRYT